MIDIGQANQQLQKIDTMTLSKVIAVVKQATTAIAEAVSIADREGLSGRGARERAAGAIDLHVRQFGLLMEQGAAPSSVYASARELRRDALRAFIENNAAKEGASYAADNTFGGAVQERLAEIATAVDETMQSAAKAAGTATKWLVGGAIAAVVVVGGAALVSRP